MLTQLQFHEIYKTYNSYIKDYPHWRKGQCLSNAISDTSTELEREVYKAGFDTFYTLHDSLIDDCWEFLAVNLKL